MSESRSAVCRMTRRRLVATAASGVAYGVLGSWPITGRGVNAQDRDTSIVLIPGEAGANFFYVPMACGAQDAAAELGVTLSVQGPPYWDASLQAALLADIVQTAPDAILIVPNDSEALVEPIQEAVDAGIAVFTLDTAIAADIALANIASDNVEGGRIAARTLAEAIGGKGKVFVVNTTAGVSSTDDREAGFAEAIAAYPDIEYLGQGRDDFADASTIVLDKLREVPDLAGVFATYLPAGEGAGIAVAQAGVAERVKVVAFDAGPDQVAQVEAGSVAALIAQHPYEMGYQGVRMAVAYLDTGQPPAERFLDTGFTVVTAGNLGDAAVARHLYVLSCDEIPETGTSAPAVATPGLVATPAAGTAVAEFIREITLGSDPSIAPSGVAVAADGTLYVIDSLQDHIRVFDRDGNPVATWGESGDGPGQFRFHERGGGYYGDLAISPDGNLYVVDSFNSRIQVLSPDGAFLREWGEPGTEAGQLARPGGIAIDSAGRIYITDFQNPRLQIFAGDGQFLVAWEPSAAEGGPLEGPGDVAVDTAGTAYVTDSAQNRVYRFDRDGAIIGSFDGSGGQLGQFLNPWGAAVDAQGNLYVADYNGNRVQVIAPDGKPLGTLGSIGKEPGQFITPIYLTIGPDGLLYVAEEGNRRVQVFRLLPPLGAPMGTPVP